MIITRISPAVKTPGRYNVYVDGAYRFSLDESQVIELGVRKDKALDEAELARLQQESSYGKHYLQTLELIARRVRSVWEVTQYARRKGWEPAESERIITTLTGRGYLDDEQFARFWIRQRLMNGKKSRREISAELAAKRIESGLAARVMAEDAPEGSDLEAIRAVIAKRRKAAGDDTKLVTYLQRKGFRYGDIRQVLDATEDGLVVEAS